MTNLAIDVYVTDFGAVELKPETKERFDDLPTNWKKIISDKRYKSDKSKEARCKANELHIEITTAARDIYLNGGVLEGY